MRRYKLRLTEKDYCSLASHLFPGDGNEAVAFAICGWSKTHDEEIFMVNRVELYPHEKCLTRKPDRVEWAPTDIVHLFEECRHNNLRLLKIHCHPGYWPWFSDVDDYSDIQLSDTLTGWTGSDDLIMSAIMLPDKSLIGRGITAAGEFVPLSSILVVGNDIKLFSPKSEELGQSLTADIDVQLRTRQAFGEGTVSVLKSLKIAVVGCSGTGSIVAELLGRLGVGSLILVDPDIVEHKNLNRILNSTQEDAENGLPKVNVLKRAIESMGTNTNVTVLSMGLHNIEAYNAVKSCDIVFGCMDSVDGRHLLNRIATYFCIPYFDIGIRLDADGHGGINDITGRVDYIQPGKSSLLSRERYTIEQLASADLARVNPIEYKRQLSEKYIKSANVESPAVISINMMFSSQAVTEMLARLHPFRVADNGRYAAVVFSIGGFFLTTDTDDSVDLALALKVGRGTVSPLLDSPMLITLLNPPAHEKVDS